MQLHQLIHDMRSGNPMTKGETMSEYLDRTYHLALIAWENIPETDKQADSDTPPLAPIETAVSVPLPPLKDSGKSVPPVVPAESTESR